MPYVEKVQAGGNTKVKYDITKIFEGESILDLNYLSMCFTESLRIEPPVATSGTFMFH